MTSPRIADERPRFVRRSTNRASLRSTWDRRRMVPSTFGSRARHGRRRRSTTLDTDFRGFQPVAATRKFRWCRRFQPTSGHVDSVHVQCPARSDCPRPIDLPWPGDGAGIAGHGQHHPGLPRGRYDGGRDHRRVPDARCRRDSSCCGPWRRTGPRRVPRGRFGVRVKLDENFPGSSAPIFAGAGHDVDTVGDEGLAGSDDRTVSPARRSRSSDLWSHSTGASATYSDIHPVITLGSWCFESTINRPPRSETRCAYLSSPPISMRSLDVSPSFTNATCGSVVRPTPDTLTASAPAFATAGPSHIRDGHPKHPSVAPPSRHRQAIGLCRLFTRTI